MTARIQSILPGSTGGIASALITGDRAAISDADEQALRDAGLAHVLAIAGLHMALVGGGLFWVLRALLAAFPSVALRYPIKKWAATAALGAARSFYLMISAAVKHLPGSTRAFVMLAMMLFAILVDRPALSMRSLALAATVILLLGPESLIEPGFQMSFAAVVGLIAVAEWEQARTRVETFGPRRFAHIRRYIRGIATTSLVGSIATVPFAIYHFDRATHYAVLGNLLAMPIMGFIAMPAAALSVFLMPFGLDAWPLRVLGFGIEIMLAMGRWVSALPGAVSVMPAWPVGALVLVSLGGLWIGLWRRRWRWLGFAPMLLGIAIAYLARAARSADRARRPDGCPARAGRRFEAVPALEGQLLRRRMAEARRRRTRGRTTRSRRRPTACTATPTAALPERPSAASSSRTSSARRCAGRKTAPQPPSSSAPCPAAAIAARAQGW